MIHGHTVDGQKHASVEIATTAFFKLMMSWVLIYVTTYIYALNGIHPYIASSKPSVLSFMDTCMHQVPFKSCVHVSSLQVIIQNVGGDQTMQKERGFTKKKYIPENHAIEMIAKPCRTIQDSLILLFIFWCTTNFEPTSQTYTDTHCIDT